MSTLDDGFAERFMAASSGGSYDAQVDTDGITRYIPSDFVSVEAEVPLDPGAYRDPFQITEKIAQKADIPELALTPQEAVAGGAGFMMGAPISAALAPLDLMVLMGAGIDAAQAEEGKSWEAFLKRAATMPSAQAGKNIEEVVKELGITPETLEGFKTGYLTGQLFGIPTGATGPIKSVSERVAKAGPTSRAIPTQPKIDVEATPVDTKLIYETLPQRTNLVDMDPKARQVLEADLKTSQLDIGGSAKELIAAAKANQAPLVKAGKIVSKDLGIEFKNPGVKGAKDKGKRLAEKAAEKGGVQQLTDITRSGFAVRTTADADAIVQALEGQYKIIDEGYNVTPLGYFDRKIMVINKDGQVGEVQIWPYSIYDAKHEYGGQDLYTLWRGKRLEDMSAAEKTKTRKMAKKYGIEYDTTEEFRGAAKEKSIELYGEALTKLNPSMRGVVRENLQRMIEDGGADSELAMQMLDMMTTPKSKGVQ